MLRCALSPARSSTHGDHHEPSRLLFRSSRSPRIAPSALGRGEIALYDVNWIGPAISGALPVQVRVRSSQALRPATIELTEAGAIVRFAEPEVGVSPGQACVVYDAATGSRVLGGGFIRRVE